LAFWKSASCSNCTDETRVETKAAPDPRRRVGGILATRLPDGKLFVVKKLQRCGSVACNTISALPKRDRRSTETSAFPGSEPQDQAAAAHHAAAPGQALDGDGPTPDVVQMQQPVLQKIHSLAWQQNNS
jgi:hypothetical protein